MKQSLKLALRNLMKKRLINLINVAGLSVSMAIVILLSAYCYSELTTDRFQEHGNNVYLINTFTPGILKEYLEKNISPVKEVVRISLPWNQPVFQAGGREPFTSSFIYADSGFFDLFTYHTFQGNLKKALNDPGNIVLTRKEAQRLFGKSDVLGKTVKLNNQYLFTVSAVIDEPAENTFLRFNAIVPVSIMPAIHVHSSEFTNWDESNFQTFILTSENVNKAGLENNIRQLFIKNAGEEDPPEKIILCPLNKIYFSSTDLSHLILSGNYFSQGDMQKVIIFIMVAGLILFIAVINFINISTSRHFERIKQAGIQKLLGASKYTIFRNLFIETFLLYFLSAWMAIILSESAKPFIMTYTGIGFNYHLIFSGGFIVCIVLTVLLLSTFSGLFPALVISSSNILENMKAVVKTGYKSNLRSILVVSQLIIAIILISFTILIEKQIRFGSKNPGFKDNNIMVVHLTPQLSEKKDVLRNLLNAVPAIKNISFSQFLPGQEVSSWGMNLQINGTEKFVYTNTFDADAELIKMLELKLEKGRFYSDSLSSDLNKVIVNEAFLRDNKITDPIGATFSMRKGEQFEIIGVIKDFHYRPVTLPVAPLAIKNRPYASYCLLQLQNEDFNSLRNTLSNLKNIFRNLSPDFPVEISFLDAAVEHMYRNEIQFRKAFFLFAGCAIVISCLGIFALSLFVCQNRTKEIGIRKVNGASASHIFRLLNRDFLKWVLVAFVISCPISYHVMKMWLEKFAYKTQITWWIFAMAGIITVIIALVTISWQSLQAAAENPVNALRYE